MALAASCTGGYSSRMPAGPRRVVQAATLASLVVLAAPVSAFASGGGNCSACQVYHEAPGPSAGRQQQPPTQPQQPTGTSQSGGKQKHAPKGLSRVLAQAGKDRRPLSQLLGPDSGIGSLRNGPGNVGSPSLLGAAFDLGAGPTVLLAILLATALGLAARGSVRGWRLRRRRPSA
jgi:hypothetical protein